MKLAIYIAAAVFPAFFWTLVGAPQPYGMLLSALSTGLILALVRP